MVRAKRLSGINPLAYLGVEPDTPLQFTVQTRAPTTKDYSNWNIGSIWLHSTTQDVWMLVSKENLIATWIMFGSSAGGLETLTGDTGGAVGPDGAMNIDLVSGFSPLSFDGNPGTFTITLNSDGTLAVNYVTDSGTAIAAGNILNVLGGTAIDTSGAGNTLTVAVDGTVATQYDTDSGSAIPVANVLNVLGGSGITTSGSGNTVTVSASGTVASSYVTDSGTAIPAAGVLNVLGGFTMNTAGAGNTVTVNMDNLGGPGAVVTDSGGVLSSINGTNGQLLIAATGNDPLWGTVTSSDASITITGGVNSLDLVTAGSVTINAGDNINITSPPTNTINLNETIHWPNTNSGGTTGMIFLGGASGAGGDRFMHNYGGSFTIAVQNTFLGTDSGNLSMTGTENTGIGAEVLQSITSGGANTAVGNRAAQSLTSARSTTAIGVDCLTAVTTVNANTALGAEAGMSITTGENNIAMGYQALTNLTTGSYNIAIGSPGFNGDAYTSSESSNIVIGNAGVVGESNTIRIGTDGSGNGQQNECYIAGIFNTGLGLSNAVYINSSHQLGILTSSRRFKEDIKDIGNESACIYNLRPVSFTYKEDESHETQYGLIAEEVDEWCKDMVLYDKEGLPESVQYHKLTPLLLNEVQNLERRLSKLEDKAKEMGLSDG